MKLLTILVVMIIAFLIFKKPEREKMCGCADQLCRCNGYETLVASDNLPPVLSPQADLKVRGMQSVSGSDLSLIAQGY